MNVAGRKEGSMPRTAPVINWTNRLSTGVSWNELATKSFETCSSANSHTEIFNVISYKT